VRYSYCMPEYIPTPAGKGKTDNISKILDFLKVELASSLDQGENGETEAKVP